jgi:NAD(P)-dependent dehydrogenase (short-subunit alcohol dehydrogenase family)
VVIVYLNEQRDAQETKRQVEEEGCQCLAIKGDISEEPFCRQVVKQAVKQFKRVDILVNNAAVQFPQKDIPQISARQLEKTFSTNIFSFFYMTKAALPCMKKGSCIINTTSVTAYRGSEHLLDYSSTKGAIVSFTRSLALNLAPNRFASTAWLLARSGRRSSPPHSRRNTWPNSAARFRSNVQASPQRWLPALCSSPRTIRPT